MNLKSWSAEHTKGLLVGIATIIVASLIIIGYYSYDNGHNYAVNFGRFVKIPNFTAKVLSLAAIANLPWFHFVSLRKGKWAFGQGIIMATVVDLLIMLLFKFIL